NAEVTRKQRQAGVRLATAKGDRIGWKLLVKEAVRVEITVGAAESVDGFQFGERDSHHAGPDAKSPTMAGGRLWTNAGVQQGLLGCSQSELMCAGRKLEQLPAAKGSF